MDRIEDPRICFFLEHQERIKEWADLSPGASQAAHEFLTGLATEFETLDIAIQQDVRVYRPSKGRWRGAFFYRESWIVAPHPPRVGIGIEWDSKKVLFKVEKFPYIGTRVDLNQKGGAALGKLLHTNIGKMIKKTEFKTGGAGSYWPAIKYEPVTGKRYWEDLRGYREQLNKRVSEAWELFSPIVDKAVKAIPT